MTNDKAALVTGASTGIGRAIAERLHADGFQVVNLDRAAPAIELEREVFLKVDLSDLDATRDMLDELADRYPFQALVNNVGTVRPAALEQVTIEDLHAVVALNLGTAILCTQALCEGMKRRNFGRIVNISSRAALGKERRSVYAATKAGLHGMTRTWALELAPHGITVNAVGPGPIDTELFRQSNPADSPRTRAILEGIPVRRLGQPADVAHAVASLVDPRAGFITGQTVYVCGGMTVASA